MTQSFRDQEVDVSSEEVDEIAGIIFQSSAVERWDTSRQIHQRVFAAQVDTKLRSGFRCAERRIKRNS